MARGELAMLGEARAMDHHPGGVMEVEQRLPKTQGAPLRVARA